MTKKKRILKEAARLFAEKGFNETSTAEIAEAAETAHGTIFYHFQTKEGLLKEIYQNLVSDYLEFLVTTDEGTSTGLEAIKSLLEFHFAFAKEHKAEFTVLHRDMPMQLNMCTRSKIIKENSEKNIAHTRKCIERGIKDGSIRADVDADGYARLFKAMLMGTARMTHLNLVDFKSPERVVIDFCINALTNREEK